MECLRRHGRATSLVHAVGNRSAGLLPRMRRMRAGHEAWPRLPQGTAAAHPAGASGLLRYA